MTYAWLLAVAFMSVVAYICGRYDGLKEGEAVFGVMMEMLYKTDPITHDKLVKKIMEKPLE